MKNQPYNVLRHRDWDAAPRDPVTIGTAIGGALGIGGATLGATIGLGVTVAGAIGYVATSLVTSWALKALSPKPPELSSFGGDTSSRGILVNQKDPLSVHDFVYGQVRKGGAITYYETTGADNKFLHQIIVLAGHELEEIGDIYLNDEVVTLDGSGFVTSDPWNSKIRINKHLGTDSQAADADLLAESNQIDANFRGRGIAYLYVRYEYGQDAFPNGLPLVTATVKGKKVYDPRTSTTAYSNNAALCVRDFITSAYGLSDDQIDDTVFSAAANICDENVSLTGGGTEKKYTINGITRADINYGDVLTDMMTACAGSLFWGAGLWKLTVGDYIAPTKTLTLDDLRSPITLATRVNLRDQFNIVKGTFNDASQRWIVTDYPQVRGATFVTEDGGQETELDLPLKFTTSSATAQRLAKLTLYRGREQMTFTADFGLNAFDVEVGEIIALTNERYGWTAKEFEVVGWSFGSGDGGALTVSLTLRETSEAAFDWNAEETALIQNNTNLPSPFSTATVGVSLDAELRVANQQVVGALLIDVTSASPFVDRFEVQFKRSSDTQWIMAGQAAGNRFEAIGVSDGLYDVRARSVSVFGARGPFNTITNFYVSLFESPPEDVTNFSANVVGNTLHLSWTPVGDLDLSHYKLRYSPLTSGAEYQKAVDLVKRISRPANTATVPSQTGTYFIKAVDKLGNVSDNATTIVIDTNVADIDYLNAIVTQDEHPDFTGAKSDVVFATDGTGNYITLDTSILFDSLTGDFDDASGLFDGGGGNVTASGTYDFDGYIDLGERYVSRVTTQVTLDFFDYVNSFDSASGLFDDREGLFDGDVAGSAFDTTSVRTQVSTTNDDPAGSPTWTDYRDFIVGDVNARALRFRAILESTKSSNAPAVRELSVEVDMPDRVEAADDITYTGSTSVTFPAAFKATPAIGIAATLADGDRYVISSKSRTGFTITTYTGASVSTNPATIDYVAKGYGKELV
jgi:hypothetical protein